jgi:MraZ protein
MTTLNKGFYVGTYRHTLDAKGRLTVPSKWRFSGDEQDGSYLALPNPNGSITVYPPKTTAALEAKIENVSMLADKDELNALIQLFATGDRFGCDAQGRIGLTEELRRYAGLVKDAILIGTVTTFHIWAPEKSPTTGEVTPGRLNFDPALLRKYGL